MSNVVQQLGNVVTGITQPIGNVVTQGLHTLTQAAPLGKLGIGLHGRSGTPGAPATAPSVGGGTNPAALGTWGAAGAPNTAWMTPGGTVAPVVPSRAYRAGATMLGNGALGKLGQ